MEDQIKQIACRLKELRTLYDTSEAEAARICNIDEKLYRTYEGGEKDIPVGILHSMATHFKMELTTLLTGEEPRMTSYYITRHNKGVSVQRREDYQYQSLAHGFKNRTTEPFIVTVAPKEEAELKLNSHSGQEFNYILEGTIEFNLNGKTFLLETGDSIYFDSGLPHGMKAKNNKPARFLAFIN